MARVGATLFLAVWLVQSAAQAQVEVPAETMRAIKSAAERADPDGVNAAVIDAIAEYPDRVEPIVIAAVRVAPAYAVGIASEASRAYPAFAERISAAVTQVTPEVAPTVRSVTAAPIEPVEAREPASVVMASDAPVVPAPGTSEREQKGTLGEFDVLLGLGAGLAPEYEGGDQYDIVPVPLVDVSWRDRVFLQTRRGLGVDFSGLGLQVPSLGVNVWRTRTFSLGPYVGYDLGRDDEDSARLAGTGDISGTFEAGAFVEYQSRSWRLSADYRQAVTSSGHDGSLITLATAYGGRATPRLGIGAAVAVTYASENYMESYFGVSSAQAASSGLPTYVADAGLKDVTGEVTFRYDVVEDWLAYLVVQWKRLLGDAETSPVVDPDSENQFFVGALAAYRY